ncbi:Nudix hydrolase 2, partial [Bienertia sinuspersici]
MLLISIPSACTASIAIGFMLNSLNPSSLTVQKGAEDQILLLPAVNDDHRGVVVHMEEPMDSNIYSLAHLRPQCPSGKKRIKFPIGLANLVDIVVKEGFWYHHAEPNYIMLVYCKPESNCTIPANATHHVGIGAIVLTEKREYKKSGRFRGTSIWKIPTRVVDEVSLSCRERIYVRQLYEKLKKRQ